MTSHIAGIPNRPSFPKSRTTAQLSPLLDRRLATYALAATAAAGIPAFGQTAPDAAVYTPTDIRTFTDTYPRPNTIWYTSANIPFVGSRYSGKTIGIDFNGDGVKDITIQAYGHGSHSLEGSPSYLSGQAHWFGSGMHHALPAGRRIGPPASFFGEGLMIRSVWRKHDGVSKGFCYGSFRNVQSMYLGVRFSINGETHFGWVGVNANCGGGGKDTAVYGTINGYAYNTVPNEAIEAGQKYAKPPEEGEETDPAMPQPGTLGALSLGSLLRKP
jgi:hypothetical protein